MVIISPTLAQNELSPLNSDDQQVHQYQQNDQPVIILNP